MISSLERQSLETAFAQRKDLQKSIIQAADSTPQLADLFNQISLYVSELQSAAPKGGGGGGSGHLKRRRLDDSNVSEIENVYRGMNGGGTDRDATSHDGAEKEAEVAEEEEEEEEEVCLAVQDISVVIPQRKKLTLEFTATRIQARDPKTKALVPGIGFEWADIEHAFLLPVPEKAQKQVNYVLFPTRSFLPPAPRTTPPTPDPLVFTIPSTAPKPGALSGRDLAAASAAADDHASLFSWALKRHLAACARRVPIVAADERLFHSARPTHRAGEKAVHVSAFRGSKDGYLFFLETGILWAFKKPMLFLPMERIAGVAYTSVLQRVFNLSVEVFVEAAEGEEGRVEVEFAMVDQEDFQGIDGYVRRYGLRDGSMAAGRKARREGVNVVRNGEGEVVGVEEAGELARAAAAAGHAVDEEMGGVAAGDGGAGGAGGLGGDEVDEEDEEEEDYHPGSAGESEGEGSSSGSEDDDADGDGGGDEDDDEDEDAARDDLSGVEA